jgi:hypothetical protein
VTEKISSPVRLTDSLTQICYVTLLLIFFNCRECVIRSRFVVLIEVTSAAIQPPVTQSLLVMRAPVGCFLAVFPCGGSALTQRYPSFHLQYRVQLP